MAIKDQWVRTEEGAKGKCEILNRIQETKKPKVDSRAVRGWSTLGLVE